MKRIRLLQILLVVFVGLACQQTGDLTSLLSDDSRMLQDSEFMIEFPGDRSTVRKISVKAQGERIDAMYHKDQGRQQATGLEAAEYRELVTLLRAFDEAEFNTTNSETCHEPFELTVRVGRKTRHFAGCRGTGANSTTFSRLAKHLEFLRLKRTSS